MTKPTQNIKHLGQVFTPPEIVRFMLELRRNKGRTLEPSAGNGAFFTSLKEAGEQCVGIEIDEQIAPTGVVTMDFFAYPTSERFDTIIGNPPYVRHQDIPASTRPLLDTSLFDKRSNLFLFFIEKCIRHLNPAGELIFIVPREFAKLTSAKKLNARLYREGSVTDFFETGDDRIFGIHTPNCAIFRFEKDRLDRQMRDGRVFHEVAGQLMFLRQNYTLPLSDIFEVKVGGVSGADDIFTHPDGNLEFVCSYTAQSKKTRRMLYDCQHPHLLTHKARLLARRVRKFDESNWWQWGRLYPVNNHPRIYVNGKTRNQKPFFLHSSPHFDGAILALFPKNPAISESELEKAVQMLNEAVNWYDLGFVCDGRYMFTQRSLQNCLLPANFQQFMQGD
ncbi:MAG: class I SAM-dependent methyltransferase [Betaproteobacteria bacterium]|nr:class I SAM-dependent methyltransferase [Betaproteobacteria bacterium]